MLTKIHLINQIGYVLDGNGKECIDENECVASNGRICGNGKCFFQNTFIFYSRKFKFEPVNFMSRHICVEMFL